MKLYTPHRRPDCGLRLIFAVFFGVFTIAAAQEPPRKIILPPPRRVPLKPAPVRPQPQVQPRQPVQRPAPGQRVQPGGNTAAGRLAEQRREQRLGQVPAGRGGNNPGENRLGAVHPAGGVGGGNVRASGLRMPPNARSVPMPGGGAMVVHPDGRRWVLDKDNHLSAFSRPGLQAKYFENGRVSLLHVQRPGENLLVAHAMRGDREAVSFRPGGVLVVGFGRDRGYVQRPVPGRFGYFARTSLVNGQTTTRVYRAYRYGSAIYFRYVPAYRYQPQFYQWAGGAWPGPVTYAWNGQQAPWAAAYSSYFTPSPSYPSAAAWLTDYVLSANLQIAYQNQQEYQPTAGTPPNQGAAETAAISPDTKNALAAEVQADVTAEQADASQSGGVAAPAGGQARPPVLDPNQRTIVVSQSLDVPVGTATCALTAGDVVFRGGDNLLPGNKIGVSVVSSKAGDCPANTSTQIDLAMLQEMQNQFQEQVDAGLGTLASTEGSGGLPAGPAANAQPVPEATAPPDPNASATLAQQQDEVQSAEATAAEAGNAVGTSGSTAM